MAASLAKDTAHKLFDGNTSGVDRVICPPHCYLGTVRDSLNIGGAPVKLGAQDVFWLERGAFTGAISPLMLKDFIVYYCIVGHSERREHFGDTDFTVGKKAIALLEHDIAPIICVGESLEKRNEGSREAIAFVTAQVEVALTMLLGVAGLEDVVWAYEPIWAIGTGRTATPEQAQEMCAAIRDRIAAVAGAGVAEGNRIAYGGSMTAENAASFAAQPDVDGGLIGGASFEARSFFDIVKEFAE
jgi:triosephosphate isomerase